MALTALALRKASAKERPYKLADGVGGALLEHIQRWAISRPLELLLVWPSDRAFPFYERAGFNRPSDPLVWTPPGD